MTCYLVLGTPRSGTTLTTEILFHLGIPIAERWTTEEKWNPRGSFWDGEFVEFGLKCFGWPWTPRPLYDSDISELASILAKRFSSNEDFGVCDPSISFYLPQFVEQCESRVKIIRTIRDPEKSVASWKSVSEDSEEESRCIIESVHKALASFIPTVPALNVDFDRLIDRPEETIKQICKFTDRQVFPELFELPNLELRRF